MAGHFLGVLRLHSSQPRRIWVTTVSDEASPIHTKRTSYGAVYRAQTTAKSTAHTTGSPGHPRKTPFPFWPGKNKGKYVGASDQHSPEGLNATLSDCLTATAFDRSATAPAVGLDIALVGDGTLTRCPPTEAAGQAPAVRRHGHRERSVGRVCGARPVLEPHRIGSVC